MRHKVVLVVGAVVLLVVGLFGFFSFNNVFFGEPKNRELFRVGVTYCGNSAEEAKILVDRVKGYTNLFVLQSGPLMTNEEAVKEIGDYVVSCGLHFAAMFESEFESGILHPENARWLSFAEERWGGMFAGVYFGDEPGGKMLETSVHNLEREINNAGGNATTSGFGKTITKTKSGVSVGGIGSDGSVHYFPDGRITLRKSPSDRITYYPNGTIHLETNGDFFTTENGTDRISQLESYEEVLNRHPIPNCDVATEVFMNRNWKLIDDLSNRWELNNRSFPIFTADYTLYWWDFQSGYDLVLAELGWNNTVAQEIGLVRGAANLQNKRWGTIITWKHMQSPYLTDGDEMFEQMRMSYEAGAEYVIIFNYAKDMEGPYGTLKDEHFEALERFWKDVVQNSAVVYGGAQAEAAFVFPKNYGWGLRRQLDSVWGIWDPTMEAQQSWPRLQDAVAKHGLKLDIIYDDPAYPFAGKYKQVYYWNQTS
jgi:hypothetical protein